MNLELFGDVAVAPPPVALSPIVDPRTQEDAWPGSPSGKELDRLTNEAPIPMDVTRVVKVTSGVWDVLVKDSRRRVYDKDVPTDAQPASVRTEMSAEPHAEDDQISGSFESLLCRIEDTDAPELKLSKLMGNLMWNDLRAIVKRRNFVEDAGPDLFGFEGRDQDELRIYDAMQWIYALQDARPDQVIDGVAVVDVMVSFEFVCERLGWNAEWIRRVTARCLRGHFTGLLRTIAAFGDEGFLLKCERKVEDYVDVTGWRNQ